jgi:hypothetical protein
MRRPVLPLVLLVMLLASCSTSKERELSRYDDPQGLFAASLPSANTISVAPAQPGNEGPGILSAVISQPPAPSPTPSGPLGGGIAQGLT